MPLIIKVLLAARVLAAGIYDIRYRRIPNWLVLTGLLAGLALNGFLFGWGGLRMSLVGFAVAFAVYFPLWILRGMGAGDVKLMAAVGALVGWHAWLVIFILTGLLGGVIAIVLMLAKGRVRKTLWNTGYIVYEMAHFRSPHFRDPELDIKDPRAVTLPHGAVIALGCLAFLGAAAVWG
ncbi:MAG: prepilin peptidase [Acidobacteria bacterium]|nr:prepilin peptidase [Acidobacteriota bacterium]